MTSFVQYASNLEEFDLLERGKIDVHSDGRSHHQRHLFQELRLIWRQAQITFKESQLAIHLDAIL